MGEQLDLLASPPRPALKQEPRAVFSSCGRYRYLLEWPTGNAVRTVALFVLANPSTATAEQTDPTVARWINYARDWGFGWCWVVNVRAWRETNPKLVPADPLAIGPDNDDHIAQAVRRAELVVCGWGKLGGWRGPAAIEVIRRAGGIPHALKLNKDGSPQHPLYLAGALRPFPMEEHLA